MPSCFSTFRQFYGIFHFSLSECSCVKFSVILSCFHFMRLHMPDWWFLVEYCVELFFSDLHSFPLRASKGEGGGGGGACSLVPYKKLQFLPCSPKINSGVPRNSFYRVPLFPEIMFHVPVIPKNIMKCSPQFLAYFNF